MYYWAKSYAEQLSAGEDYTRLRRTISICFVNRVVFPEWPEYHTCFRLLDPSGELCLTEDLEIHVIELPKFRKTALPRCSQPRRDREIVAGKDLAKYLAGVLGCPMNIICVAVSRRRCCSSGEAGERQAVSLDPGRPAR